MQSLSQLDQRWGSLTLGQTPYTIARWGCTTTAICMVISKFVSDWPTPGVAAKKWSYTKEGLLIWGQSDFEDVKFIKRGYGYNYNEIAEYANSKDKGVIIEVNYNHWVAASRVDDKVYVYDPLNFRGEEPLSNNYRITGYSLFEAVRIEKDKNKVSEWAQSSVDKAIDKGVATVWDDPQKIVATEEAEIMLYRVGLLDKLTGEGVSKERLAVALDNGNHLS